VSELGEENASLVPIARSCDESPSHVFDQREEREGEAVEGLLVKPEVEQEMRKETRLLSLPAPPETRRRANGWRAGGRAETLGIRTAKSVVLGIKVSELSFRPSDIHC
jgi:hypothetical protein